MEALPHSSGSAEEHLRVSLAPGGHPLELPGDALEGVAEPQGLSVVAAGYLAGVVVVLVRITESISRELGPHDKRNL